jgi:hypothetical protein
VSASSSVLLFFHRFVGILEVVADWMNSGLEGSNTLVSEQGSRQILYQKVCFLICLVGIECSLGGRS